MFFYAMCQVQVHLVAISVSPSASPPRYYRVSADSLKVLTPRISFTNP